METVDFWLEKIQAGKATPKDAVKDLLERYEILHIPDEAFNHPFWTGGDKDWETDKWIVSFPELLWQTAGWKCLILNLKYNITCKSCGHKWEVEREQETGRSCEIDLAFKRECFIECLEEDNTYCPNCNTLLLAYEGESAG